MTNQLNSRPKNRTTRRRALTRLACAAGVWFLPICTGCRQKEKDQRLLIKNGQIVNADQQLDADVLIQGERIIEIGQNLSIDAPEQQVIDADGLQILPGGIDPHVHLSGAWVDDFSSGSRAALAGGITTIGNISFSELNEGPLQITRRHSAIAGSQAIADVMLHPVIHAPTSETIECLPELAAKGHTSIKFFMLSDAFEDSFDQFLKLMEAAGRAGILSMIHCEDYEVTAAAKRKLLSQGKRSLRYFAQSHPVMAEVIAVKRAVDMCERTGAPIYVVHLSSERALRICEDAKSRGLPVFVETRPLYLHLTAERLSGPDGPLFVGQPPLRGEADQIALWNGLANGSVHVVATDHAPWTRKQKMDPRLDIVNVRAGVNNLQVMLPMLYSEGVLQNRISLQRFVAITATNAAKLFGLYPQKGKIAVGSDADLVLWSPRQSQVIDGTKGFSKAGFSIYSGRIVTGWPKLTIRRGEVVFADGKMLAQAGGGQLLQRTRWSPDLLLSPPRSG